MRVNNFLKLGVALVLSGSALIGGNALAHGDDDVNYSTEINIENSINDAEYEANLIKNNEIKLSVKKNSIDFLNKLQKNGIGDMPIVLETLVTGEDIDLNKTKNKVATTSAISYDNTCYINLDINTFNDYKFISENNLDINFENEEQKRIFMEFVLVHEYLHCLEGDNNINSKVLNNEDNKLLNDLFNINQRYSNNGSINHQKLISENSSDAGAYIILLQKYGKDNKDLNNVINLVEAARESRVVKTNMLNDHSTFGVFSIVRDNISKIDKVTDLKSLRSLADDISNKNADNLLSKYSTNLLNQDSFKRQSESATIFFVNYAYAIMTNEDLTPTKALEGNEIFEIAKRIGKNIKLPESLVGADIELYSTKMNISREAKEQIVKIIEADSSIEDSFQQLIGKLSAIDKKYQDNNKSKYLDSIEIPSSASLISKINNSHKIHSMDNTDNVQTLRFR